jgi:hypothetical protein
VRAWLAQYPGMPQHVPPGPPLSAFTPPQWPSFSPLLTGVIFLHNV